MNNFFLMTKSTIQFEINFVINDTKFILHFIQEITKIFITLLKIIRIWLFYQCHFCIDIICFSHSGRIHHKKYYDKFLVHVEVSQLSRFHSPFVSTRFDLWWDFTVFRFVSFYLLFPFIMFSKKLIRWSFKSNIFLSYSFS